MTTQSKTLIALSILLTQALFSCQPEDPGPLQSGDKDFGMVDFDELEMGNAFNITVEQSNTFSIKASGDVRNLNDIEVYKNGSTLIIRFDKNVNRKHSTHIVIRMPTLQAVNFAGASVSTISGFESTESLNLNLSGASVSQLEAGYREVDINLSGASNLIMRGLGDEINAEVSGASLITAFDYPVRQATLLVSGASHGKVTVSDDLMAKATGASSILYRGSPTVNSEVSGASSVQKD